MRGLRALLAGSVIFAAACGFASASAEVHVPEGREEAVPEGDAGLALKYPNDKGIGDDPDVVFTEDFETRDIAGFKGHWSSVKNQADALSFSGDVPKGSPGRRSLGMTARRGRNEGGHLFNRFKPGWDELYARCYVKLSADYGLNHHFVKLQGAVNPPPYPMGGAGSRPTTSWTTGLEPTTAWKNTYPGKSFAPPGHWFFYSYWPEMHSFQTPEGKGTKFYGNAFAPWKPVMVERGKWICLEWMVRMNSAPGKADGAQRFWIDGNLVGDWSPGKPKGYWMRDTFRCDESDKRSKPFEGFRWRRDMRVKVNKFWLLHYVSHGVWKKVDGYKAKNPGFNINAKEYTVWFDDIVLAKKYIGPIFAEKDEPK